MVMQWSFKCQSGSVRLSGSMVTIEIWNPSPVFCLLYSVSCFLYSKFCVYRPAGVEARTLRPTEFNIRNWKLKCMDKWDLWVEKLKSWKVERLKNWKVEGLRSLKANTLMFWVENDIKTDFDFRLFTHLIIYSFVNPLALVLNECVFVQRLKCFIRC